MANPADLQLDADPRNARWRPLVQRLLAGCTRPTAEYPPFVLEGPGRPPERTAVGR